MSKSPAGTCPRSRGVPDRSGKEVVWLTAFFSTVTTTPYFIREPRYLQHSHPSPLPLAPRPPISPTSSALDICELCLIPAQRSAGSSVRAFSVLPAQNNDSQCPLLSGTQCGPQCDLPNALWTACFSDPSNWTPANTKLNSRRVFCFRLPPYTHSVLSQSHELQSINSGMATGQKSALGKALSSRQT